MGETNFNLPNFSPTLSIYSHNILPAKLETLQITVTFDNLSLAELWSVHL